MVQLLSLAGTPPAIVRKINADIAAVLKQPDVLARLQTIGAVAVTDTPTEFDAVIHDDTERYGKLLKALALNRNSSVHWNFHSMRARRG